MRRSPKRRGTDRLVIERRLLECAIERAAPQRVERWTVKPQDSRGGRRDATERPLPRRAVAERELRRAAARVVAHHDFVRAAAPDVASPVGRRHGKCRHRRRPPRRLADRDGRERKQVARVSRPGAGNGVRDGWRAVERRDREARRIQAVEGQHRRGALPAFVLARAHRVQRGLEHAFACALHEGLRGASHRGERGGSARADVEHPAPARMPGRSVVPLDIGMERVRHERSGNLVQCERRGGRPARILARLLIGAERLVVRMQAPVEPREP